MIKFKFLGFIISFLTAILVITNGNGSLFQNAFGDSDSISDSVDEIVESAEEESDDVRDEAEEIAEEFEEDTDDEARDGDSEESEDNEDNEEESENRGEDDSDDALSDLQSEIEDEVGEIKDNIVKDETNEGSGLGEGSGMQIFVSPRERVNEILDQHLDNIEEQVSNPPPTSAPGGVGSPGDIPAFPHLDLTFDEDINNLSPGDGNEGNHIFLSPIFGGLATGPGGNDDDGNNPPPGFNIPPCTGITFCDPDNGLQGTNRGEIIEGGLNILFPTGGVGASPGEIAELPDIAALIQDTIQDTEDITRDTVDSIIASGVVSDGQPQLILDFLGRLQL